MTPDERQELLKRIQDEMARLEKTMRGLEQSAQTVSLDQPIGRLSRMDSLANQAMSGRALEEARARMTRLKRALAGVDHEDFGLCAECGEDIGIKRLLALPDTRLCVDCAQ